MYLKTYVNTFLYSNRIPTFADIEIKKPGVLSIRISLEQFTIILFFALLFLCYCIKSEFFYDIAKSIDKVDNIKCFSLSFYILTNSKVLIFNTHSNGAIWFSHFTEKKFSIEFLFKIAYLLSAITYADVKWVRKCHHVHFNLVKGLFLNCSPLNLFTQIEYV